MDIEQLAGTRLGNYEIERLVGRSGMSVAHKDRHINLDRHVALRIPSEFLLEPLPSKKIKYII